MCPVAGFTLEIPILRLFQESRTSAGATLGFDRPLKK
jgi:hypothetical protein